MTKIFYNLLDAKDVLVLETIYNLGYFHKTICNYITRINVMLHNA